MANGTFILMLHSHLPYLRKAGSWPHGEENIFECVAEVYLPLLVLLEDLLAEGIKPGLTLGLTPVLCEQLADPYLMHKTARYLEGQMERARHEKDRWKDHEQLRQLAEFYEDWFGKRVDWLDNRFKRNLLGAFSRLQEAGAIELVASAASHGFLPLLRKDESIRAQVQVGKAVYEKAFGRQPKGFWLPECAYRPQQDAWDPVSNQLLQRPGIETFLEEAGVSYTFTEYHALDGASTNTSPGKPLGVYTNRGPAQSVPSKPHGAMPSDLGTHQAYRLKNSNISILGRDNETSFQVWSSIMGYPGDGQYREFYKTDDSSGFRYWRLTSKTTQLAEKHLYDTEAANAKAREHAEHFIQLVAKRLNAQAEQNNGNPGLVTTAFDTELFGHWWFEGIVWLEHVLRGMAQHPDIAMNTAHQALEQHPPVRAIDLPECTWGEGGHFWVWNNNQVDWVWPAIGEAEERLLELASQHADTTNPLTERALNQALRELLLLQASDWPFLITTYQAKDYAKQRFEGHRANFWQLCSQIERNQISEDSLASLEDRNALFANLNFRTYIKEAEASRV